MAGQIKKMIDAIIAKRANGNELLINTTRTKLIIKGFHPDKYSSQTEDDPIKIAELKKIAEELGIKL